MRSKLTWFVTSVRIISLVKGRENLNHMPEHPVCLSSESLPRKLGRGSPIILLLVDAIVSLIDRLVAGPGPSLHAFLQRCLDILTILTVSLEVAPNLEWTLLLLLCGLQNTHNTHTHSDAYNVQATGLHYVEGGKLIMARENVSLWYLW